jgi:PKD repeat protein
LAGGAPNTNNNPYLIREPISLYPSDTLSAYIGDSLNVAQGDFGAGNNPLPFVVENTTPSPFGTAQRSDFYESVPAGSIDPITGVAGANALYLGYFLLNPNGTETFTRAAAIPAPVISSVTSTVTNGFAPLTAVFTNTATGSITNWVWNFGNGTIITNTTGNAVTNTYTTSGTYTVTLTLNGPAGSSTSVLTSLIVASPTPKLTSLTLANDRLVLGGTNAPAGLQYRILTATNVSLPLASWTPVLTNTIQSNGAFGYTNTAPTNRAAYFRLVSP